MELQLRTVDLSEVGDGHVSRSKELFHLMEITFQIGFSSRFLSFHYKSTRYGQWNVIYVLGFVVLLFLLNGHGLDKC